MNAHAMDSLFGPPSEPVDISAFIQSAGIATGDTQIEKHPDAVATECSVSELRDALFNTWNNPNLSAYLSKDHEHTITSLYATTKSAKPKRKAHFPDPSSLMPEVLALQKDLDNIKLSSWKLQAESALFMRSSKNSDQNVLTQVKLAGSSQLSDAPQAVITISVHNRLAWSPGYVTRSSQHTLLSSQTLGDLFKVIPCTSNELVAEDATAREDTEPNQCRKVADGCVICIENIAYGDGLTEVDYAERLIRHLATNSKNPSTIKKATTSLYSTPFSSFFLRVNQPYWLLHHGNCEHFIVVDQIRLQHPSDPSAGYPLTLQITPPLLALCRACVKVPAVLSIVGDVRLGESPCLMCGPCWRNMGDSPDEGVTVVSLPSYESGW